MKKKIFLTLMALAVLATALVGCSWNEVTGISLKGDFDTEFTLYDLSLIHISPLPAAMSLSASEAGMAQTAALSR